jgi:hypothetical protein
MEEEKAGEGREEGEGKRSAEVDLGDVEHGRIGRGCE